MEQKKESKKVEQKKGIDDSNFTFVCKHVNGDHCFD